MRPLICLAALSVATSCLAAGVFPTRPASAAGMHGPPSDSTMKIRLIVNGTSLPATLDDTPSSRDLLEQLPLTLTWSDYGDIEKVSDLPRALTREGAPAGVKPATGDITYYAPWGNLAIFVRDFSYSTGLIRLGRLEGDLGPLRRKGTLTLRIERDTP